MDSFETFSGLHYGDQPFLLGNVWDANSAVVFERSGVKAVGTSSAAIAHSLGYEDGEQLPFEALFYLVQRIRSQVSIPVSVDIEGGYSRDVAGILRNIERLYETGVVGINIEDTVMNGKRELLPIADFQRKLSAIVNHLEKNAMRMFINARTDAFLLGLTSPLQETIARSKAYEQAGASGLFVPCISRKEDIQEVVAATRLPLNVLSIPGLPSFDELAACGVKRISMGNAVHDLLMATLEKTIGDIRGGVGIGH